MYTTFGTLSHIYLNILDIEIKEEGFKCWCEEKFPKANFVNTKQTLGVAPFLHLLFILHLPS